MRWGLSLSRTLCRGVVCCRNASKESDGSKQQRRRRRQRQRRDGVTNSDAEKMSERWGMAWESMQTSALAAGLRTPERSTLVHLSAVCHWRWRNEAPDAMERTGAGSEVAGAQSGRNGGGRTKNPAAKWRAYGHNCKLRSIEGEKRERIPSEVNRSEPANGTGTRVAEERRGRTPGRSERHSGFGDKTERLPADGRTASVGWG